MINYSNTKTEVPTQVKNDCLIVKQAPKKITKLNIKSYLHIFVDSILCVVFIQLKMTRE